MFTFVIPFKLSDDTPPQRNSHPKPPRMRMYADDEELKSKNSRYLKKNFT